MADEPTIKDVIDAVVAMESRLDRRIDGLKTYIDQRFAALEVDMKSGFDAIREDIRRVEGDMESGFTELRPPDQDTEEPWRVGTKALDRMP